MKDFSSGWHPMCNFSGLCLDDWENSTTEGRPPRAKTPSHTWCVHSHEWQSQEKAVVRDPAPLAGHSCAGPVGFTWRSPYWETGRPLYSHSVLSTLPLLALGSSISLRHGLHKTAGDLHSGFFGSETTPCLHWSLWPQKGRWNEEVGTVKISIRFSLCLSRQNQSSHGKLNLAYFARLPWSGPLLA